MELMCSKFELKVPSFCKVPIFCINCPTVFAYVALYYSRTDSKCYVLKVCLIDRKCGATLSPRVSCCCLRLKLDRRYYVLKASISKKNTSKCGNKGSKRVEEDCHLRIVICRILLQNYLE